MAAGAPGDLRHLRRGQPPAPVAVELGESGEGDMVDVHVEAHADRVGGDEIIDLAGLEHADLGITRPGAQGPEHNCGAAALPPHQFGQREHIGDGKGDDRRARRQPRELGRAYIGQGGETRPRGDLGLGQQGANHRLQAFRAENHGFLAPARMEHAVGEDMAALRVGAELGLVDRDERDVAIRGHALGGAEQPARVLRQDLLLAGDQGDLVRAL